MKKRYKVLQKLLILYLKKINDISVKLNRLNILGVGVSPTNMKETLDIIQKWIQNNEKNYICVTGVHGIMECQKDNELINIHNSSGLTVPDGMPLVWIGRLYGFSKMKRVYGPDLMLKICRRLLHEDSTHFLYGGNYGVTEKLKIYLESQFPSIRIVGIYTPPFRPLKEQEKTSLFNLVKEKKPDVFWVGLSTPKQEKFMFEYLPKLDTKVMIGVGAAFDIHTGSIKDAPAWMKKFSLQWLHRLFQEPRRLWKRYLYSNPAFMYKFFKSLINLNNS